MWSPQPGSLWSRCRFDAGSMDFRWRFESRALSGPEASSLGLDLSHVGSGASGTSLEAAEGALSVVVPALAAPEWNNTPEGS